MLETCRALEDHGFELTVLPVGPTGLVSPSELAKAMRPDTALVSIMIANNEIGTIQPIAELAAVAREGGALFHTDAVQALGKLSLDVDRLGVDLLSVSAHKLHGPKGVGALYFRRGVVLSPLIHGGGQEHKLRSGTENVPGVVGFGRACELAIQRLLAGEVEKVAGLRDRLQAQLLELVPDASVNGDREHRLPNTLNLTLPGIRGESLVLLLDRRGVQASSGSACKAGNPNPSHALLALGLSEEQAHCCVRFSLDTGLVEADIDYATDAVEQVLADASSAVRFVSCR